MEPNIKIYVSCHRPSFVPDHALLYPLEVGTSLRETQIKGILHDNEGAEHISGENRYYCELTGQYWAWKNEEADYYGFFHYRRYFSFAGDNTVKPCIVLNYPNQAFLEQYGYDEMNLRKIILQYDIIVPMAVEMHESVYDYYKDADNHDIKDLELAFSICKELYPHMEKEANEYLYSTRSYFCNMYIMKKEIFHSYCQWLFPVLNEWDKCRGITKPERVDGYLSERLFGVYYLWLSKNKDVRRLEVPRVDFELNNKILTKKKILDFILPSGSRRRVFVKKFLR